MKIYPPLVLITVLGIASAGMALYWAANSSTELLDLRAPAATEQSAVVSQAAQVESSVEHTDGVRLLDIRSISNFRDIGGYATSDGRTTKWRTLYRSGDFSRFSAREQPQFNALEIATVVDLRSDEERARAPSRWHDAKHQPEIVTLPIGGGAADWTSALSQQLQSGNFTREEMDATFIAMYGAVPLGNQAEYKLLFNRILDSDGQALLIHCTAGKDRTGIGTALILSALDVPRATIMQDFMLTNETVDVERMSTMLAKIFSRDADNEVSADAIGPMLTVQPEYLETSFAAIEKEYGSVDNYLRDAMGLTDAKRAQLKATLLD